MDYRQVNNVTKKDAYPLPKIDNCLDAMAGARIFSSLDLRSAYQHVPVAEKDRDKTTFICPRGMYRYTMMPFGLCNAVATFQRLMDVVLSGMHFLACIVYLDDIIVFSRTPEQHLDRLEQVFDRLERAGLKMKPDKCELLKTRLVFLGHVLTAEGVGTDPEKTAAIEEWPTPTTTTQCRAFYGLASYYRRFVKNFAGLAAPLHELMKKHQRFFWDEDKQEAFDALKEALSSPPILIMPTDDGDYILDTDASEFAIGAVLSQVQDGQEKVVAYASRSLDKRERNYCVTRKELLAIVHFLKHFKQYLLGRHFRVRTDHAALTWLRRVPEPIGQQARWLEQMEEFDFSVEHRAGRSHANADGLSRKPCVQKECRCKEVAAIALEGRADRPIVSRVNDCASEETTEVDEEVRS